MIDRKPRARIRRTREPGFKTYPEVVAAIRKTQHDDAAWNEIRLRVARFFAGGLKDRSEAPAIADAFHRRPELLPGLPPAGADA